MVSLRRRLLFVLQVIGCPPSNTYNFSGVRLQLKQGSQWMAGTITEYEEGNVKIHFDQSNKVVSYTIEDVEDMLDTRGIAA